LYSKAPALLSLSTEQALGCTLQESFSFSPILSIRIEYFALIVQQSASFAAMLNRAGARLYIAGELFFFPNLINPN
jgi:hypothetical protein